MRLILLLIFFFTVHVAANDSFKLYNCYIDTINLDENTCKVDVIINNSIYVNNILLVKYSDSENYVLRMIRSEGLRVIGSTNNNELNQREFNDLIKFFSSNLSNKYKVEKIYIDLGLISPVWNRVKGELNFYNESETVNSNMIHLTARIRKILEEDVLLQNTLQQIYDRDRQDKTFKMKVGLNSPSFMSGYYYKNWIDLKHVKNYGIDLERTWYRIELN